LLNRGEDFPKWRGHATLSAKIPGRLDAARQDQTVTRQAKCTRLPALTLSAFSCGEAPSLHSLPHLVVGEGRMRVLMHFNHPARLQLSDAFPRADRITLNTRSRFCSTSLFQNRTTR